MVIVLDVAAWLATAAILSSYAILGRTGRPRALNWANALGVFPLALTGALRGAWQHAAVSVIFGLIGWWAIIRARRTESAGHPRKVAAHK